MNRTALALAAVLALGLVPAASAADDAMTAPINAPKSDPARTDASGNPQPAAQGSATGSTDKIPTIELKPEDKSASAPKTAPGTPKPGTVSMDDLAIPSPLGDMALGRVDAPVTVVEYASMTCSHCAAFDTESLAKLRSGYVDTGKVRYVFREFPLDIKAVAASILIRCIAKSDADRFFDLTDRMFRTQDEWLKGNTAEQFKILARKEGLEEKAFEACFADASAGAGIQLTQMIAAEKLKVNSTPTFFVNGLPVKGNAWPEIEKAIKAAIADRS